MPLVDLAEGETEFFCQLLHVSSVPVGVAFELLFKQLQLAFAFSLSSFDFSVLLVGNGLLKQFAHNFVEVLFLLHQM